MVIQRPFPNMMFIQRAAARFKCAALFQNFIERNRSLPPQEIENMCFYACTYLYKRFKAKASQEELTQYLYKFLREA